MYGQMIEAGVPPHRLDELGEAIQRRLVPALREQPGFSGALSLVDQETGRAVLLVLWESDDEAARPLADRGVTLIQALAAIAELSSVDPCAVTVWEVNARV
jgi:hypothetical protein